MRPKGAKGANTTPKSQVGPPEPILAPNLNLPKNDQKDLRTQIGQESCIGHFQPLASGNHQRPPAQVQKAFASIQGKYSPSPMYSVPRIQAWCIYGIIYHYEPIFLRNPMVMLSGPNYAIPVQVSKIHDPFQRNSFQSFSLSIPDATRRPFEDPNHLALQELGCIFLPGLFQG
ncbi:hypothetical protein O181_110049 [Austropuccinia psidii MF-1]|uniref:Uncharacterized protein n=1 Tax=Austropuccinia psidii MF-1 TaxID=1389203 RepID=A0A9Q3PQG2_9BASI|nr:hypothetical protein [Austropuccinia psidii MF-1]